MEEGVKGIAFEKVKFTKSNVLWDSFIVYHTETLSKAKRDVLRKLLFGVHYGNYDTKEAFEEVARINAAKVKGD